MKRKAKSFWVLAGLILVSQSSALISAFGANAAQPAPAPKDSLDTPLKDFMYQPGDEFYFLCIRLDRPCGEELASSDEQGGIPGRTAWLDETTPRQILDDLSRRRKNTQWSIRDGVLMLEPRQRPLGDLLGKKLAGVSIRGTTALKAAKDVMEQAGLFQDVHLIERGNGRYVRIDLELKNVTIREALNAIVKADGRATWFFYPDPAGNFSMVSISTWRTSGGMTAREKPGAPLR